MKRDPRPHLTLIPGGQGSPLAGPMTRLGLWERFQPVPRGQLTVLVVTKLVLLGTIFYFWYR